MNFEREIAGYRYAETLYGDDLRRIALREMGDAAFWIDIANLNGLLPPYLTDDPAQVRAGVLLSGSTILIPAPQLSAPLATDPTQVFGTDILLTDGRFSFVNGDLATVSGGQNFLEALRHRLQTSKRELLFHPTYGCFVDLLIGRGSGPTTDQLAAFYVKSALLEDARVAEVVNCVAEISGDTIRITADVVPIDGKLMAIDWVL